MLVFDPLFDLYGSGIKKVQRYTISLIIYRFFLFQISIVLVSFKL